VRPGLGAEDAGVLEQRGERRLDEAGGGEVHAVAPGRHGHVRGGRGPRRRRRRRRPRRRRRRVHHRVGVGGRAAGRELPEAPASVAEERWRRLGVAGRGRMEAGGEAEAEAAEGRRRRGGVRCCRGRGRGARGIPGGREGGRSGYFPGYAFDPFFSSLLAPLSGLLFRFSPGVGFVWGRVMMMMLSRRMEIRRLPFACVPVLWVVVSWF
jgi:hypothetical protein